MLGEHVERQLVEPFFVLAEHLGDVIDGEDVRDGGQDPSTLIAVTASILPHPAGAPFYHGFLAVRCGKSVVWRAGLSAELGATRRTLRQPLRSRRNETWRAQACPPYDFATRLEETSCSAESAATAAPILANERRREKKRIPSVRISVSLSDCSAMVSLFCFLQTLHWLQPRCAAEMPVREQARTSTCRTKTQQQRDPETSLRKSQRSTR